MDVQAGASWKMTLLVTVVNPATSESMVYVICGKVDPFVQQTSLNLDASNTHTHTHREIPPQPVAWHDLPHQKAVFRLELQGHAALEVLHGIQELYLSCLVAEPRCSSPADRHDRRLLDDSSVYRPVEPGSRTARSTQATGRSSEPGVLSKKAS